jgi:hypothetical protein
MMVTHSRLMVTHSQSESMPAWRVGAMPQLPLAFLTAICNSARSGSAVGQQAISVISEMHKEVSAETASKN